MPTYDFTAIEKKWQTYWYENGTFHVANPGDPAFEDRPKLYVLDMFPYPSGAGLHVGHPEGYTATDIVCRFARMNGYNVLHPMGYDSFGLPAEQYAVEHGVHPRETTRKNIENIERQIKMFGFSYDWSRRVATTDPEYYRWTQWIFLQLYNSWFDPINRCARPIRELIDRLLSGEYRVDLAGDILFESVDETLGEPLVGRVQGHYSYSELDPDQQQAVVDNQRLAYMAEVPVNWCPALGTVLANEEVTNEGRSERGDHPVYRRALKQWMLRITAYAERLLDDLDLVDWPEPIKIMQRNWIGKSVGADVFFNTADDSENTITTYTTRPDTLYGATYMVLAPEHPLVEEIATEDRKSAVREYIDAAVNKSDLERTSEQKLKTGVFTGGYAVNPVNGEAIPIWVADYVLMSYGTGAIMAVPAHDERDFDFAQQFDLPIRPILKRKDESDARYVGGLPAEAFETVFEVFKNDPEKFPAVRGLYFGAIWDVAEDGDSPYIPGAEAEKLLKAFKDTPKGFIVVGEDGMKDLLAAAGFASDTKPFPLCITSLSDDLEYIHSEQIDGLAPSEGKTKITRWLEQHELGRAATNYKLRDWLFSRQRYWGEPFPIVHCERCGTVPVDEDQLPLRLPEMDDFSPSSSDDPDAPPSPPLGKATDWVNTPCPACGEPARRELNTMPQWAGSCWYYLRYLDPDNHRRFCDPDVERYWMTAVTDQRVNDEQRLSGGVDLYVGGAEHAVLHLLYSRFWHKVLYDLGYVSTAEPFSRLFNQGMILSFAYKDSRGATIGPDAYELREEDGEPVAYHTETGEKLQKVVAKMSKSLKNVVNPDEIIEQFGADTFRMYEMFMGPLEASKPWNTQDVPGVFRFLQRVWRMIVGGEDETSPSLLGEPPEESVERALHKLTRKVAEDIRQMKFNTAIAAMMEFVNTVFKVKTISPDQAERFVLILSPFAPHIAEELWQCLGHDDTLGYEGWPKYDESLLSEQTVEIPVQVNGKVRSKITAPADAGEDDVIELALTDAKIAAQLSGKQVVKRIYVPGRLVNLVVK